VRKHSRMREWIAMRLTEAAGRPPRSGDDQASSFRAE
jgi:hypothetical protein